MYCWRPGNQAQSLFGLLQGNRAERRRAPPGKAAAEKQKAHPSIAMRPEICTKNCNHPQGKMGSFGATERISERWFKLLRVREIVNWYYLVRKLAGATVNRRV